MSNKLDTDCDTYYSPNIDIGGSVTCGFMELLIRVGEYSERYKAILISPISRLLLERPYCTLEDLFDNYYERCLDNVKLYEPDTWSLYQQEPERREFLETTVRNKIILCEQLNKARTLQILADEIPQDRLDAYEAYFKKFIRHISKDVHAPERLQRKKEVQREEAEEAQKYQQPDGAYEYDKVKIEELHDSLVHLCVINNRRYAFYDFEHDVANADFSQSVGSFASSTQLKAVISLLNRLDYIEAAANWLSDAAASVKFKKNDCHTAFNNAKGRHGGWLNKLAKEINVKLEKLNTR